MIIEKEHLVQRGSGRDFMNKGFDAPHSPSVSHSNLDASDDAEPQRRRAKKCQETNEDPPNDNQEEEKKTETFDMVATFQMYPEWLRKGPWSPLAALFLVAFFIALVWTFQSAVETGSSTCSEAPTTALKLLRVGCGVWGLGFCAFIVAKGWSWAFVSYTVWSWTLASLYFAASAVRDSTSGRLASLAHWVAAAVRFPALVQVSVTVALWWLVLFPMIYSIVPGRKKKMEFVKFNFGFIMLNIHGAVFPAVVADLLLSRVPLNPFDLWTSFAVGFVYMIWYLFFMDRNGIHMYIFLSPRPHFSPLIYAAILALYTMCYAAYNQAIGGSTIVMGFDTATLCPNLPAGILASA